MSDKQKLDLINQVHSPILHKEEVELAVAQKKEYDFSKIVFEYNPDKTVQKIRFSDRELSFVWNSNKTLASIRFKTEK